MQEIIGEIFSHLSRDEIVSRLNQAKIANAQLRTIEAFLKHPQLAARQRWREVDSEVGLLPTLLPPVALAGVDPVIAPIPALGEPTDEILAEVDYDSASIVQLHLDQVV